MGTLPSHVGTKEEKLIRSEMTRYVGSGVKLKTDRRVLGSTGDQGSGEEVTRSFGFLPKLDRIPQMH
jgi:hypothetical protein